jgi:hypothetical protein
MVISLDEQSLYDFLEDGRNGNCDMLQLRILYTHSTLISK